jgi:glycosyltransferase involved in cell wall biosynthesis
MSPADRLFLLCRSSRVLSAVLRRARVTSRLEKELIACGADLAYFVTPSRSVDALDSVNYIYTVWDLCHRDFPEFPEVRDFHEFRTREFVSAGSATRAATVLVDSVDLAERLRLRYGIDQDRILTMPFGPSPFLSTREAERSDAVLASYGLEGGYFFYPGQLWAHKNHVRVLEALALLNQRGTRERVVFAGGDGGNRRHLEAVIRRLSLESQVRLLGFVPASHMKALYEGSVAVAMPTYFGPTNLPPLEAWSVGRPLIYSRHLSAQAGTAAALVDPDDANALADAMMAVREPKTAAELVTRGKERLLEIARERDEAEAELVKRLYQFEQRRKCWA